LDYIQELGASALYLTPIFTSPSNHKYDVENYKQVDPHFGGNEALIALRQALDERNMKLMLDMVPNHCSATHPWFLAAQADPSAPTAEFFTFYRTPNEYESWFGIRSLPKLNYRSEHLRELMYAGQDAIMRYWLRPPFRIDGWRLDVANMLARQGESQFEHKVGP
jgi:alpha-glucosidase